MKLIIITGPSGSGKSSLGKALKSKLKNSHILCTDDFYKTGLISYLLSKVIKSYFDKIISLNQKLLKRDITEIIKNKKIDHIYNYDFKKKRINTIYKNSMHIENLIIEGIFGLNIINFISKYDYLLIRLKIDKEICKERIIERDQNERGKDQKKSIEDFQNAWEIYQIKEKINQRLNIKKELIFKKDPSIEVILKKLIK